MPPRQIGLVGLLDQQQSVRTLTQALKSIPPSALWAHEVQTELIDVWLGLCGLRFKMPTDLVPEILEHERWC